MNGENGEIEMLVSKPTPPPDYTLFANGTPFASKGNIILLSAPPKGGKSTLCTLLAAAALGANACGITGDFGQNEKKLVWIDTEQTEYYAALQFKRAARLSGLTMEKCDMHAKFWNFANVHYRKRNQLLTEKINEANDCLVILDGIGDFVLEGINDEKAAVRFVDNLLKTAKRQKITIVATLHANANGLARGWLGAETLRKCETNLCVKTQKNGFAVDFPFTRGPNPTEFYFYLDSEGLPVTTCEVTSNNGGNKQSKFSAEFWTKIFDGEENLSPAELKKRIVETGVNDGFARKLISNSKSEGFLIQTEKGKDYSLF